MAVRLHIIIIWNKKRKTVVEEPIKFVDDITLCASPEIRYAVNIIRRFIIAFSLEILSIAAVQF